MDKYYSDSKTKVYLGSSETLGEESNSIDLVLTDPPYGIGYLTNHRKYPSDIQRPLVGDAEFPQKLLERVFSECYRVLKDKSAIYVFTDWRVSQRVINILKSSGFNVKNLLIWVKNNWTAGDLDGAYAHQYEMIIFATKGDFSMRGARPQDVVYCDKVALF